MATQFQGPPSDPCVLYKHFWQEPRQPMHKDDLILQACHYQPSDTQRRPSFSPCDYFPSHGRKEQGTVGALSCYFIFTQPDHRRWTPPPDSSPWTPFCPCPCPMFTASGLYLRKHLAKLLATCGEKHLDGPGPQRASLAQRCWKTHGTRFPPSQTLPSGKESRSPRQVLSFASFSSAISYSHSSA